MNKFKEIVEENFSELPNELKKSMAEIAHNHAKNIDIDNEHESISIIPLTLHLIKRLYKESPDIKINVQQDVKDLNIEYSYADIVGFDLFELSATIGEDNALMELQNLVITQTVRDILERLTETGSNEIATKHLVEGVYTIKAQDKPEDKVPIAPRIGAILRYKIIKNNEG